MIKSVNNYPVSQLFDIEAGVVYGIPRYQREYSWSKLQLESLFDDLLENDQGYFLGSIICINQSTDSLSVQKLELVDGQQRLTTLSLLFAAVYQALKTRDNELDDEQRIELLNLKRKLVLKKGIDDIRLIPQIQNNNQDDYRAVLSEAGIISHCPTPFRAGNRKIFRAYRYFQERVEKMNGFQKSRVDSIVEFLEKVNLASMVKIEVVNHADAYTLFESLNNRGMPLTAVDLIKNKLLARLEHLDPGRIDYYFDQWKQFLDYLGDDYSVQERFFRQYYNAFKDDLKAIHNVPVATRSNLIEIYEKIISHDARQILEDIITAGRIYSRLISQNRDEVLKGLDKQLRDLERIQGAPAYLLLLYLLVRRERKQLDIDDKQLTKIVSLLVRFFVRRNLTDLPPTRDLTRLFMAIIEKLKGRSGDEVIVTIKEELIAISASDEIFLGKLIGPIYEENAGATRFILCALAEQAMTKETWVDLWRFEKKQYVWTIEHIFPQGKNIPQSWVKVIADGDEHKAKEIQDIYAHKLGNLTISGFNRVLGNKSFKDKRDRKDDKGNPVGYKNNLKLNEDLASSETWSVGQIEARTKKLVNQAMKLFSLEGVRV